MSTAGLKALNAEQIAISGEVDFYSTPDLWKQLKPLLFKSKQISIDLSGIKRVNSAGLAILLEARGLVEANGGSLEIRNPPANLMDIASMCNVLELMQ